MVFACKKRLRTEIKISSILFHFFSKKDKTWHMSKVVISKTEIWVFLFCIFKFSQYTKLNKKDTVAILKEKYSEEDKQV